VVHLAGIDQIVTLAPADIDTVELILLQCEGGPSSSNFRPRLGCYAEAITTPPG
jgi:hypothetical protein